ncbi:copper resistance CopC family protein [Nocardia barduliensis]|uniref:copper resistance CopC family protein n=1 Tax=Nocardia barduliensis TaxID=2736643 RepID=UPI001572D660|nr:copper resistance CopC family protein [Nocardia barduliensis]
MSRRLLAALVAGLFLLGFGITATGIAAAHSAATASVPEDKATVDAGPERASVTFNEVLQPSFPSLTVVGPDGNLWSKGDPVVEGRTVSVALGELGPVGEYTIAYRVTSADGHPVSGKRHFTLSKPGNGTPGPKPNAKADGSSDSSGGIPLWVFIVGAIVLFGGGLAFALFGGRSRNPRR